MHNKVVNAMTETLAKWVLEEINRRHMSIREFSRFCGIGNQTLNNILDPTRSEDEGPSLRTLARLARATKTDLCVLVAMIEPNLTTPSARARLMADRIARLSREKQDLLDSFLLGELFKEGNEGD